MRRASSIFFGFLLVVLASMAACGDDTGTSSTSQSSTGGDGGNSCPQDGCPTCGAGETCCNGVCVNLLTDIKNCGACCNSCPNPHPVCNQGSCEQAQCNLDMPNCNDLYCCDMTCCPWENLCCPNGDGTSTCSPPNPATGSCP